jgi:hypothetical protein
MSEGETHARLVSALLEAIRAECGANDIDVRADMTCDGRYGMPYEIAGMRPDLLVRQRDPARVILGEAKTFRDIDTVHTREQLKLFLEHLITQPEALLWLSVPLVGAGAAVRVVRVTRAACRCEQVPFRVSGWLIGAANVERRWHG